MLATVIDGDKGVEVEVEFETESDFVDNTGTSLEVCASDVLSINGESPEEVRALGHRYYVVELDGPMEEVRIDLEREDETINVVAATPPVFAIESPLAHSDHARADALEIAWAPAWSGQEVELAIEDKIGSDCIEGLGYDASVEDSGSFSLPAGTLVGGEGGGSCEVKVSLTRVLEASYPEQLAPGGSIIAVVNRRLPFNSID